jgi:hypothetical protein
MISSRAGINKDLVILKRTRSGAVVIVSQEVFAAAIAWVSFKEGGTGSGEVMSVASISP